MRWEAQLVRSSTGQPDAGTGRVSPKAQAVQAEAGVPHLHPLASGAGGPGADQVSTEPLIQLPNVLRTVRSPEFEGMTFHEVVAKSALNRVPESSNMPFRWTVNPYRGCTHACVYCFARKTHTYLDLDYGRDFDSQVVVKRNVAEVLRAELRRPSWGREHVALGTNTDPYQRAEGRYRLMPDIIEALSAYGTPFSILTKGTLLARDVDLLARAAERVPVGVGLSIAMTDDALSARVEPGTPSPTARLRLLERLAGAGVDCHVMAMPILPWLSDSDAALDSLFERVSSAGASRITVGALHLRPGAREWYFAWLTEQRPDLVPRYREVYRRGAVASKEYRSWLTGKASGLKRRHGLGSAGWRSSVTEDSLGGGTAGGGPGGGTRTAGPVHDRTGAARASDAATAPLPGQAALF
ncbi:Rv2578c family radical SAM protein [Zhihengliuella sp.]|uniref:Rv2578c family radical SAM protein n=1 Tax=Zhihengliuella sp. TaxID=1954483 RepID=UPI0035C05B8F